VLRKMDPRRSADLSTGQRGFIPPRLVWRAVGGRAGGGEDAIAPRTSIKPPPPPGGAPPPPPNRDPSRAPKSGEAPADAGGVARAAGRRRISSTAAGAGQVLV
jgi:hypothetical protein